METLVFFPKLKILGMNSAGVTDENIMNLGYVAESLPNLITLYLSANDITDEGAVVLSTLLSGNKLNLRTLNLGKNPIEEQGILSICLTMENNTTLKVLALNDLNVSTLVLQAIDEMLCTNDCLEELNLGNNNIDDEKLAYFEPWL